MRDAARCAGWIFAAHALCGLILLTPAYIRPDSVATYSYLRSMVFDRDLSFYNEWAMFGLTRNGVTFFSEVTPTGALANHWWIGTSMLAAPFYLVLRLFAGGSDGFFGAYGSLLAWSSVFFTAAAMWVACLFIRSHRAIAIIATVLGTPLFWYTFRYPLGTHAAGTLCVALIFASLFVEDRQSCLSGQTRLSVLHDGALVGLAAGLAIATRLQHFVLIPAIVTVAIVQRRTLRWWIEAISAGALPIAAQAIAWFAIYGTPLGPLTRGANLQGVTWMPFQHIALAEVLFSSYHGLLAWSPIAGVAIAGWVVGWRRNRDLALTCILMFAGEWLANGTFDRYFWGGMSFGGRRFVDLAVPFALGIAWFAERVGTWIAVAIVTPLVGWSVALMVAAQANTISLARYVSGSQLFAAVFSIETWRLTPLHTDRNWFVLLPIIVVAAVMFVLRRYAIVYAAIFVVAVAICAARTPACAPADIDLKKSARVGPLLDERRLLGDEVDWARARGDAARVRATSGEIAAIDRALVEISR